MKKKAFHAVNEDIGFIIINEQMRYGLNTGKLIYRQLFREHQLEAHKTKDSRQITWPPAFRTISTMSRYINCYVHL